MAIDDYYTGILEWRIGSVILGLLRNIVLEVGGSIRMRSVVNVPRSGSDEKILKKKTWAVRSSMLLNVSKSFAIHGSNLH